MKFGTLLRILGSAALATVIVLAGAAALVNRSQGSGGQVILSLVKGIDLISGQEARQMIDADRKTERKPLERPMPPPVYPQRNVSGIVEVDFTVGPDGQARNVHVARSAPAGYYEEQAKAIVESNYYKPTVSDDGRLLPRKASTIIHFKVPAHEPPTADGGT